MKLKLYIFLLLVSSSFFAQQKQVETSIDTIKNKIGAQFNLTLKTTVDTSSIVVFPNLKNFGNLEVIRSYVIDTIENGAQYQLIKRYGLTQFDSGKYTIPSLKVLINNKLFLSDSIKVEVANVAVDTLRQKMFDIKPIAEESSDYSGLWKYIFILLLILGIGALIYFGMKKYQTKKAEQEIIKTPIEKATTLLQNLEKKELWQKGEIKTYYSELTDIARNYIEEAIEIPAMESTTSELIVALRAASVRKKMTLSPEILENLERVLKQADLVKFAKSKPLDFEITEDRNKIEKAILTLDNSIPIEVEAIEENLLNEAQKLKQAELLKKKQKKTRIITAVGFVIGAILGLFIFFVMTKGFAYVKDNVLGHPTKELLESEWIQSNYGNPSVAIETPKVLKRIDISKSLPPEGMALIKEMQSFAYGSILDNFYLMVSTAKFKQETQIDLPKALEGSLQFMEAQGAQNVIIKQEEFNTKEGISGLKGYGTFSKIDGIQKKSVKIYYEIIVFSQEGGLQQIILLHEEGDNYAEQISERVLNSVEFKKVESNE
ncbi:MAG: hypothetical protein V4548_10225 [Bacteroidota bacterium]